MRHKNNSKDFFIVITNSSLQNISDFPPPEKRQHSQFQRGKDPDIHEHLQQKRRIVTSAAHPNSTCKSTTYRFTFVTLLLYKIVHISAGGPEC